MAVNNLEIEQGTTWQMEWPVTDEQGEDIDLTGYTAKAQVRSRPSDSVVMYEWDSQDDTILLSDSTVTLILEAADSAAWEWKMGVYDILLTSGAGDVSRVSEGTIKVKSQVTR